MPRILPLKSRAANCPTCGIVSPLNPEAWRQDNLGWLATHPYVRIDGPILLENPFYEPAAPPAYELCSAWFLIALSMPEKISA
jgi:hypothetical protein